MTSSRIATDLVGDACSLETHEQSSRIENFGALWEMALIGRERTEDAVVLTLRAGDDIEATARELAAAEQQCCPGFVFDFSSTTDHLLWTTTVNEHGSPAMLDALWDMTNGYVAQPEAVVPVDSVGTACCENCS